MNPDLHHPENHIGRFTAQARCKCGWKGHRYPRFLVNLILWNYVDHHLDWLGHADGWRVPPIYRGGASRRGW